MPLGKILPNLTPTLPTLLYLVLKLHGLKAIPSIYHSHFSVQLEIFDFKNNNNIPLTVIAGQRMYLHGVGMMRQQRSSGM